MTRRIPTELPEGADGVAAVDRLYKFGRTHAGPGTQAGKPTQRDYVSRERPPHCGAPQADWAEYSASFRQAKNSPVSNPPDESENQFVSGKVADHVDVRVTDWTRSGTHPHFDSGPSGRRYRE
jgi:hypothetical protein